MLLKFVNVSTLLVTFTCYHQFLTFLWSLSSNPTRCFLQFITNLSHVRLDSIILSAIKNILQTQNHIRLFRIILASFHKIKIEDVTQSCKIMAILIVTIILISTDITVTFHNYELRDTIFFVVLFSLPCCAIFLLMYKSLNQNKTHKNLHLNLVHLLQTKYQIVP